MINNNLVQSKCSMYKEETEWNHVVRCEGMEEMKEQFAKELEIKVKKDVKSN